MKLIFDEALETKRTLTLNRLDEKPMENLLVGNFVSTFNKMPTDIKEFGKEKSFSTLRVENNGKDFPIIGNYNTILNFIVHYNADSNMVDVSIVVGWLDGND